MSKNVQPRTGETHGLFGVKFLKHHNMRDPDWTVYDLISQYEKLSFIFRKSNEVSRMQKEKEEIEKIEMFKQLKKKVVEKREELKVELKGDVQRTKNALQDFSMYQRMYHSKQSYEVSEKLAHHDYKIQEILDRYRGEKLALMKHYEQKLINVANFQETIRYYDIKEFPQEQDTKRLHVELKNSETRIRALEKMNVTFKKIIDQLMRDSVYYEPVLSALMSDWNEQSTLVQQTFEIGYPAIQNAKKFQMELNQLRQLTKREDKEHFNEITASKNVLKKNPKVVKQLVRRDSDFSMLGTHYDRDTKSMTDLKLKMEDVESTIKMLKSKTLCSNAEEIFIRVEMQPKLNQKMRINLENREGLKNSLKDKDDIAKIMRDLLLDDLPQIYNDEKLNEIIVLEESIKIEREKQLSQERHVINRGKISSTLRFALQHMLDISRHVGTPNFYTELEYPSLNLQLPLLDFNEDLPEIPKIVEYQIAKLISSVKSKVQILTQHYNQKQPQPKRNEIKDTLYEFQKVMNEVAIRDFRPKLRSFED